MNSYQQSTLDNSLFNVQDVSYDNACFYRAVACGLYQGSPHENIGKIMSLIDWGESKTPEHVADLFNNDSKKQDRFAKLIQSKICEYVSKNPDKKIPDLGNISIKDAIFLIHDISWEEYLMHYSVSASEINFEMLDEEGFYIDRWGSTLEQWVVSEIFQIPIVLLNPQTWSNRHNKIINGKIVKSKAQKNVRFRPTAIIGKKFLHKRPPIFLIWKEYNGEGHYMACFPKNNKNVLNLIKNMI